MRILIVTFLALIANTSFAEISFVHDISRSNLYSGEPVVISVADRSKESISRLWINSKNLNRDTLKIVSDTENTVCVYNSKESASSETGCSRIVSRDIFVESIKAFVADGPIREVMDRTSFSDTSGLNVSGLSGGYHFIHGFNVNTNEVLVMLQPSDGAFQLYRVYDLEVVPVSVDMNYLKTTAYFYSR